MTPIRALPPLLIAAAVALAGCGLFPFGDRKDPAPEPAAAPAALGPAPEGCAKPGTIAVPRLRLPRTETPRVQATAGKAHEFAQVHTVNRPLEEAGVWTDLDGGWSVLSLEIGSEGARSLAVRLRDSVLPEHTAVWLCSLDGRERQGPFREAAGGDLWTPPVAGNAALMQVWLPTALKGSFRALLADAYGGYR